VSLHFSEWFYELPYTSCFYVAICLFLVIDEANCNYVAQRAVKCAGLKAAVKGCYGHPIYANNFFTS
jgi:hypothetical protein